MKTVVVLSGGMDSAVALAFAKKNGYKITNAINFNYGSKHNEQEGLAATAIANFYGVPLTKIELLFINKLFKSHLLKNGGKIPDGHYEAPNMKKTVVPFRNGIMLSIAAGYAESVGAKAVIIGNHAGDHAIYPDCREEFIKKLDQSIKLGTYKKIKILSPFVKKTKTDIAKLGNKLGVPFDLTWSCYKGLKNHCGKCGTCVERKEAFLKANLNDLTIYENS